MLNSYIVSASIRNSDVNNLKERVSVTFTHLTLKQVRDRCFYLRMISVFFLDPKTSLFVWVLQEKDKVRCVFWDFQQNGELVVVFQVCTSGFQ